ncbi:MAG: hypothetical protein SWX82_11880 [Cyanobacteriota bacterium]|nr:hypothetical protein [Cyanobacteriota bacterium]
MWLVAFDREGTKLISVTDDRCIKLWDIHQNRCLQTFKDYLHWIWSVAMSPDSNNLAIASAATFLQILNLETEELSNWGVGESFQLSVISYQYLCLFAQHSAGKSEA